MKSEEMAEALRLLFEHFWIIKKDAPEQYNFLRRHQKDLQKEVRQRFGMNVIIRPQYIQLLKRPIELHPWMGDIGFSTTLNYALFCCCMAFVEGLEAETPFMLDELLRDLDLIVPEEMHVDWTNYNHRKGLIHTLKKMAEFQLIEIIQGETDGFEQSVGNQEILFVTTIQARAFLARAPQSYTEYADFQEYWQDYQASLALEGNQLLYQRLMMEPVFYRTPDNEEVFVRLRNYHHHMKDYVETNTDFYYELYRDYAAFTLERREQWEVFPSRKVIDEILIQLATVIRNENFEVDTHGVMALSMHQWQLVIQELGYSYRSYWSKEFTEMTEEQLSFALLTRGKAWQLFEETAEQINIQPVFGRLIAEMEESDGK